MINCDNRSMIMKMISKNGQEFFFFFWKKRKESLTLTLIHTHSLSHTKTNLSKKKLFKVFSFFAFEVVAVDVYLFNDQLMNDDDDEMTSNVFKHFFTRKFFFSVIYFLSFLHSFIHSFIYLYFFLLQNDEDKTYHQQITCTHIIIIWW